MSIVKLTAVFATALFLSSVSAQAMEFANRPGSVFEILTSASPIRATPSEERLRRQINDHNILQPVSIAWMKLGDRPRPISNLNQVWVVQRTFQTKPGRLSAEFSAIAESSRMRFEYGPGEVSSWLKPTETRIAQKESHHRGPVGNLFPPLAAKDITFADRGFTSSLSKVNTPSEIELGKGSAESCVGSMAPCGSVNFVETRSLSAAYNDKRL